MKAKIFFLQILFLVSACNAQSMQVADNSQQDNDTEVMDTTNSLTQIHQSLYCGTVSTSQWITSSSQLDSMLKASRGHVISDNSPQVKPVDFSSHGVALISMGQQRSGGYAVKLASTALAKQENAAIIKVHWREPARGMIVTQALTNPCLFVSVPLADLSSLHAAKIRVVDSGGKLRAEIQLPTE